MFTRHFLKCVTSKHFPRTSSLVVRYEMSPSGGAQSPKPTLVEPVQQPQSQSLPPPPPLLPQPVTKPQLVTEAMQIAKPDESKAILDVNKHDDNMLKMALSFDEVPGPQILKMLAKAWSYLPLLGTQLTAGAMVYLLNMLGANLTWNQAVRPFNRMFDKYGPVIRLQGPLGGNIIFLSRPEHIETVYRQEGRYPVRSAIDSLEKYRLEHRKLRISGPFIMSGPEWEMLRTKVETPLQRCVVQYSNQLENASQEMIYRVRFIRSKQEEVPPNFYLEIYKWSLECIGLVVLDKRLGLLNKHGLQNTSETTRLMEALLAATAALRKCESGLQLWRFFDTPSWNKLVETCDIIDNIVAKHIRFAQCNLRTKNQHLTFREGVPEEETVSLLEALLFNEGLFPEDILTVILDMLIIGVNSTAHAMSFVLYHLSQSVRMQRQLFEEVLTILPKKESKLTTENIHKLCLLQACVKESLRLKPPIPVMTRVLPKDISLHCYRIPKGTYMLMTSHVAALREENFEDAHKFKPERWLTGERDIHPFAAIPFGHGPRSCLGRGLAELQLWFLTAKIIRNFRIEYHYGAINAKTKLIAVPDKPLKFRFIERSN